MTSHMIGVISNARHQTTYIHIITRVNAALGLARFKIEAPLYS